MELISEVELIPSAQSPDVLLRFLGAPPMGTPFVPCWDFAGVVHEVGADVKGYKVGDEVFGVVQNIGGEFGFGSSYTIQRTATRSDGLTSV